MVESEAVEHGFFPVDDSCSELGANSEALGELHYVLLSQTEGL